VLGEVLGFHNEIFVGCLGSECCVFGGVVHEVWATVGFIAGWWIQIVLEFSPRTLRMSPILTGIFFNWVGSTTN